MSRADNKDEASIEAAAAHSDLHMMIASQAHTVKQLLQQFLSWVINIVPKLAVNKNVLDGFSIKGIYTSSLSALSLSRLEPT